MTDGVLYIGHKRYSSWSDAGLAGGETRRPGGGRSRFEIRPAGADESDREAGFRDLRMAMWMNLGRDFSGLGRTPGALKDVARVEALWADTRARFGAGGPFLFGSEFSAADAMFAPVVARLLSWKPGISAESATYCAAVRGHPLVMEWYDGAAAEPEDWLIEEYETAPLS